ncbi:MAG: (2Fe-2S) ferredoxin domain-containing protein [Spirochaetales bacterium]|nr:(2Fe-2S) ferredoxin domain-containing protein [Spirochaetales bacterium]
MVELTVCIGTSCHLRGATKVIKTFQHLITSNKLEKNISLKGAFCMGQCSGKKVRVSVNSNVFETSPEEAEGFFLKEVLNTAG